jgi:hypothetical protein
MPRWYERNYKASVANYDAIHVEISGMGDMLSNSIISQFPERFAACKGCSHESKRAGPARDDNSPA